MLGVRPILGRTFLPNEEEGADVALVSEKFWRNRLGGDPNVLGRSITLDGDGAHDRRRVAEHAGAMGRPERERSLDDKAVRDRGFFATNG